MKTARTVLLTAAATGISWTGCSVSNTPGVTVSIVVDAPSSPELEGGSRRFVTDLGFRVELTRGYLTTESVEIFGCPAGTARSVWHSLLARDAFAHVTGAPTRWGVPVVESLLAPSGADATSGDIHPAEGAYCRVKQAIGAADADASGLPADAAMVGKSLFLTGTYARADEGPRPFTISSTASFDVETVFTKVELAVDGRSRLRLVLTRAGDRWFDGVDFQSEDESGMARTVLENVRRSLGARVE